MCAILSKYVIAEEPLSGAYCILYCLERSSRDSMGVSSRETVRKAAKFAVYEAIMMNLETYRLRPVESFVVEQFLSYK